MSALWQMVWLVLRSLPVYLQRPDFLLIVGVVLLLVYRQYARTARVEQRLFGVARNNPRRQTVASVGAGLLGGLLATLIFVLAGVPLSSQGLWYVWVLALLLATISPRFLCFSYAGGLVSLASIFLGVPTVHVASLMALVAVLHLAEAILIAFTGAKGATPVYVRRAGKSVVGGFVLQRFWPIPLLALVAGVIGTEVVSVEIFTPQWWPLVKPGVLLGTGMQLVYGLFPVVAVLGYSDLALTCRPKEKARQTAGLLLVFGLTLLTLAVLAQYGVAWEILAALFSVIGHESVIIIGRRRELQGTPIFVPQEGPLVLDTLPGFPAAAMGLVTGDVIRRLNGEPVPCKADITAGITPWAFGIEMDVVNVFTAEARTVKYKGKVPPLGLLLAPDKNDPYMVDPRGGARLWRRLQRWWQQRNGGRAA